MKAFEMKTPLNEVEVRQLRVGDTIYLTGKIFTMRDQAHRRIIQLLKERGAPPMNFEGLALYHCGPVVKRVKEGWRVISAGPTTSSRMESYEAEVMEKLGVRMVIGKGGMGPKTMDALTRLGAVYVSFVGGAAVLAADCIEEVEDVLWLDLGMPEAVWIFKVKNFGPLTVSMDSYGNNLYRDVMEKAKKRKRDMEIKV